MVVEGSEEEEEDFIRTINEEKNKWKVKIAQQVLITVLCCDSSDGKERKKKKKNKKKQTKKTKKNKQTKKQKLD